MKIVKVNVNKNALKYLCRLMKENITEAMLIAELELYLGCNIDRINFDIFGGEAQIQYKGDVQLWVRLNGEEVTVIDCVK